MDDLGMDMPFGGAPSNGPDSVTNSSAQENNNLEMDSKVVREEKEKLKELMKRRDLEIRGLRAMNQELFLQLNLQQLSLSSIPGASSFTNAQAVSSMQPQASSSSSISSSCGNCEKKDRLLQERDETIATLLSDVLQRLWASRGDHSSNKVGRMTPGSSRNSKEGCGGGGAIDKQTNGMLQQKKILDLFNEVLPVLIRQQGLQPNGHIDWQEQWFALLSCRGVCKSWKSSVDTLLQNDAFHREICTSSRISSMIYAAYYTPCPAVLEFHDNNGNPSDPNIDRIRRFTEFFMTERIRDPVYNPIPSRHLKIGISCADPIDIQKWSTFAEHVLKYLQLFGRKVWYLTLHGCRLLSYASVARVYGSFIEWLQYLPNLKSLTYGMDCKSFPSQQENRAMRVMMGEQLESTPQLRDLAIFQMEEDCVMGFHILKSNLHIQKLRLSHFVGGNVVVDKALRLKFPNLTELSISISSEEQLKKLGSVSWKLRKLSLSLSVVYTGHCFYGSILNMLPKFSDTLEDLTLDLMHPRMCGDLQYSSLGLPRLKHLRMQYVHGLGAFRWDPFFRSLRQLETVEIVMNQLDVPYSRVSNNEKDDFLKSIHKFQRAFYWDGFPHLKSVKLTVVLKRYGKDVHSRHLMQRWNMSPVTFDVKISEKSSTETYELYTQ